MKCTVYPYGFLRHYKYVVVFVRHENKWLLCNHKERKTWENAGGHIEVDESPEDAAKRELYEETGALDFDIMPVCDYWACDEPHENNQITWANGQVFLADVRRFGSLPDLEMKQTALFDDIPLDLTHPDITNTLLPHVVKRLDQGKDYVTAALKMGAENAVKFAVQDIVFDSRVVLKCLFGCADYGRIHTCPYQKSPLTMDEYREIFSRYKWGIIIGCRDKDTAQRISFEIERACFLDGYYFAFSLSDCGLCVECAKAVSQDCRFPQKARPAFHSVGIDVFKTAQKFGLPIAVLKEADDPQHWYSAVFVE